MQNKLSNSYREVHETDLTSVAQKKALEKKNAKSIEIPVLLISISWPKLCTGAGESR